MIGGNIMFCVIDCGTTNTRVYIVNEKKEIIGKGNKQVGVKDVSIAGSKEVLKKGIQDALYLAIKNANVSLNEIKYAIASGMITSEVGLIELPHIIAPAGKEKIAENICIVRDESIFPFDMPVMFVRGIKNNCEYTGVQDLRSIDFMRGEETQVVGLLEILKPDLPINIIVLSSHTKLINVDKDAKIMGSITTISGQIFNAIIKGTSIGSSIKQKNDKDIPGFFSEEIFKTAIESNNSSGFLRSLLMPRFMEVLMDTEWYERRFFVDCIIGAEDMNIIDEAKNFLKFDLDTDFILVGNKDRCKIYEKLLKSRSDFNKDNNIVSICNPSDIDMFAIKGAIELKDSYIKHKGTGIIEGVE